MAKTDPPALFQAVRLSDTQALRVRYFSAPRKFIDIQDALISITWTEEAQMVAREFTLTLDNWNGITRPIRRGGLILIQYRDGAKWSEWFRGTVISDGAQIDSATQNKNVRVQDVMRVLGRSEGRFSFKANTTASTSIRKLLADLKLPVGRVDDTRVKLPALTYSGKFYDAIQVLLLKTRQGGGARFHPELAAGKFYLVKYKDPVWSWDLDDVVSSASSDVSIEDMVGRVQLHGKTTVTVEAAARPGSSRAARAKKKATRRTSAVASANRTQLLSSGIITIVDEVDEANSSGPRIRRAAQQRLAAQSKPKETLEFVVPSDVITFRRLQPVVFDKPDPVTGAKGRYFISSLSGSLDASGGSMSISLTRRPDFYKPETAQLEFTKKNNSSAGDSPVTDAPTSWPGNNASKSAKAKWMGAAAQEVGLPAVLPVMAALGESGMNQYAKNKTSGATGLFQIITRYHPGVDPLDPEASLKWFLEVARTPEKKRYSVSRRITLKQALAQGEGMYGEWISRDIEGSDAAGSYYQGFLGQAKALLGA